MLRPFYFNVVLWGKRFRDYFLDLCLPSLLSPGNIPALENKAGSKFLIAAPRDDWDAMRTTAIWRRLEREIEPVLLEIPYPAPGVSGCQHMGVGHILATERAFQDRAYFLALTPDLFVSDGSIANVQRHAREGKAIVLVAALRFAEEPLLDELRRRGRFDPARPPQATGEPLVLPPREMTAMALRSLHSESRSYVWDEPFGATLLPLCLWRVGGDEGMIVHSFSWAPFLLDYGVVKDHDTSALQNWTFDGDYVHRNFAGTDRVHVVEDSDEIMMVSWSPLAYQPFSTRPRLGWSRPALRRFLKSSILEATYHGDIMDPFKRNLFPHAVTWHSGEVGRDYERTKRLARRYVRRCAATKPSTFRERLFLATFTALEIADFVARRFHRGNGVHPAVTATAATPAAPATAVEAPAPAPAPPTPARRRRRLLLRTRRRLLRRYRRLQREARRAGRSRLAPPIWFLAAGVRRLSGYFGSRDQVWRYLCRVRSALDGPA